MRIGLTISGAIALGSYEGGVLAALLAATQAVNEQEPGALRIDAIAGASAGSITGLLAARTLLVGGDPIDAMYGAWVTAPQLSELSDGSDSPLDVERLRSEAELLLGSEGRPEVAQSAPIRVSMALGCLRGLEYRIGRIGGPPIDASTYLDWSEWEIDGSKSLAWYTAPNGPVDAALASGAHAAAFPPRGLDRSDPDDQTAYQRNGIVNFPPSKYLWYTDGGTIDNQPLGRALRLAQELDGDGDDPVGDDGRLHLMITPDPAKPTIGDDRWSSRDTAPSWATTGLRTVKLLRTQRLYDDLREAEKTNARIEWTRRLGDTLLSVIAGGQANGEAQLRAFIDEVEEEKGLLSKSDDLRGASAPQRAGTLSASPSLEAALRDALGAATGLANKRDIAIAVISPQQLPEVAGGSKTTHELLAGEFLGHFGGFIEDRFRENDFALGYRSALEWLDGGETLARYGLPKNLALTALNGAEAAREAWAKRHGRSWVEGLGSEGLSDLSLREKLRLLRLALRSARIAFSQVRKGG